MLYFSFNIFIASCLPFEEINEFNSFSKSLSFGLVISSATYSTTNTYSPFGSDRA